ncbi:MAG: bifunctional phosphopantothenoylcysteine decarboxylase/phosphopantothenate--cysteine ligase CoaBC [Flavobacteriaceae bacterium]|nr:MAG: bifunctional phosphopantothenoylcysteine decarboxylase/phosphopantothenate--cysteine ligase CoaBC [Flavobacteriaceae bacterium]
MSVLKGKKIVVGISAGIAAYKTAHLVRYFIKAGAEIRVIMTPASKDFVTPLTLSTLSNYPVASSFYNKNDDSAVWNSHVEYGLWADFMIIAPATANTMAKMANGICDNLLLATYLSSKCPVYFAPTMDLDMYLHPSTLKNIETLKSFGNTCIPATSGFLASGLIGEGRMAEPESIVAFIEKDLSQYLPLKGEKVMITAGPTYESIDPVRFIGNHSSGKMGFELAREAANLGAEVVLISGPSNESVSHPLIQRVDVVSAQEMYDAAHADYNVCDIVICAAAVADYTPKHVATLKIKKSSSEFSLDLMKTKDILASLGAEKKGQFLVGFALETDNEINNALGKLKKKNLDLIVLNSLRDKGAGFKKSTNKVTLIDKSEKISEFSLKSKAAVAVDIFNEIISKINA